MARATAKGLQTVVAPLFTLRPLDWEAPDPRDFQAVLLTSANAAHHGGGQLRSLAGLPCYAVGEATADAARASGFGNVRTGPSDGAAVVQMMADDGIDRALHLCARDHMPLDHPKIELIRRIGYAAEAIDELPSAARAALEERALVLLHSPRAAQLFAQLVDEAGLHRASIRVAAISKAAAAAAGDGWRSRAAAEIPRDDALLELAAKLCQTISGGESGTGA